MKDKMTNRDRICIIIVHIFLILLGLSHYYSQNILNILIVSLIFAVMIISSTDIKLILLFLILPFFNLLSVKIGSNSFFYIFLIYVLISILKKNKWSVKKKKIIVIMCGVVLTVFWQNPMVQIKWVIIFSSVYLLLDDEMMEKNMPLIIVNIALSTIEASGIGYIMMSTGKSIYNNSVIYSNGEVTTRFAGLIGDSVFFTQFCVVLIGCIITFVLIHKIDIKFAIASVVVLSGFVLITYSKTGIILLIVTLILSSIFYIQQNVKNKKNIYRVMIFIMLFFTISFGIYKYIVIHSDSDLISNYMIRFNSKDLWTGRNSVTDNYLMKLNNIKYIFTGMTISNYTENGVVVGATMITKAHNIYLETLCLFGVLPSILIMILAINKIIGVIRIRKNAYIQIIPIFLIIISGISLHGHLEWPYYFLVLLSYSTLSYSVSSNNNKKELCKC